MSLTEILYKEDGPIGTITLNRPHDGNMFTETMCHEIRDCINNIRREMRTRVIVITGTVDKFFCTGGGYLTTAEHDKLAASFAERRKPDTSQFGH